MKHKNIPKGYKDSPLGIIPKEWDIKKIKYFGKVITGNTPSTVDTNNYGDEYMFVSPADLSGNKYITNTEKKLSFKGFLASRIMPKGTVLFTCIGSTIGKSGIATKELTSNQQINAIICNKSSNNEFLYYVLCFKASKIKLIAGEQAVPIINKSDFENIKIVFPPVEEQKRIAELLSVWDEAIEKQIKLIDALIRRKLAIIKLLFNRKKRLCDFCEEWEKMELGDCLKIGNGKDYKHLNAGDVPVLGTGGYMLSVNDYLYDGETVCIGRKGTIDKPMYHKGKIWTVDTLFYTHSYKNVIPLFIYYLFNLIDWQKYNEATGVPSLSKNTIEHIPVLIPTLTEQIAIVEILTNADNEIELAKQKLKNIQVQKKGIMQKLLTGKTRI